MTAIGPGTAPPKWQPPDDATLAELWASGLSATKIGAAMGRTKSGIIGRSHRLGLPPRGSPLFNGATCGNRPKPPRPGQRRKPKPPAVVPPVARVAVIPAPTACQWPEGDGPNIRFECRDPTVPGRPYCAAHCARAYLPPGRSRDGSFFQRGWA
jgi:GcrA cell cycle regulator